MLKKYNNQLMTNNNNNINNNSYKYFNKNKITYN